MRQLLVTGLIALMATTAHAGALQNAVQKLTERKDIVQLNLLKDEKKQREAYAGTAISHISAINEFEPKDQTTKKMRFNGQTVPALTGDEDFKELMAFKFGIFKVLHERLQQLPSQADVTAGPYDWALLMANALRQNPGDNTGSAFLLLLAELEKTTAGGKLAKTMRTDYADLMPAGQWDVADASTIEPAAGDDKPVKQGFPKTELPENDFLALTGTRFYEPEPSAGDIDIDLFGPPEGDNEDVIENPNDLSPNNPQPPAR